MDFANSMWFVLTSLFQQASTPPQSVSGRLLTCGWWMAVLIFSATYTANLSVFLTEEARDGGIQNIDDLAKQNRMKYGEKMRRKFSFFIQIFNLLRNKKIHGHI